MKDKEEQNEYVCHLSRIISFPHCYIFIQLILDLITLSKFQVLNLNNFQVLNLNNFTVLALFELNRRYLILTAII